MATAKAAAPQPQIALLTLDQISESPLNPRQTFDKTQLAELADDVGRRGVLQPVLVRPLPDPLGTDSVPRFELVFGARRFRAAKLAKLGAIPAMVRDMNDEEVLETQLVENAKRADVHPLEEAEAYEKLHEDHGHTVDEIAAKVGKSKAFVYGRMKLLALCKPARKAYFDGKLTASTALLVARIPHEDLQKQAVQQLWIDWQGQPMSYRQAAGLVQERFMLRLKGAPFRPADANLVPDAGACSACLKRSGSQPELFHDVDGADVCTDPKCFRAKTDAAFAAKAEKARAKGLRVIDGKAAKKLFPYASDHLEHGSAYVSLNDTCWDDAKNRTFKQILGGEPEGAVIAQAPSGRGVMVLPKAKLAEALKAAGVKPGSHGTAGAESPDAKRRAAAAKVAKVAAHEALREIAATAAVKELPDFWRFLASLILPHAHRDQLIEVCRARCIWEKGAGFDPEAALEKEMEQLDDGDMRGLCVQLLAGRFAVPGTWSSLTFGKLLTETCGQYGIDLQQIHRDAKAAAKAKKKAPAKKKASDATAESCIVPGCTNKPSSRNACRYHLAKHRELVRQGKPGLLTTGGAA